MIGGADLLVSALWYWGYTLNGTDPTTYVTPRTIIYITWPLAALSFAFSYLMFFGLPDYYRQIPPYVPNFFRTLGRRKLVIWFFIAEVLRDYWLTPQYGRNWQYLWQASDVHKWAIVIMIAVFFIGVWGVFLGILIREFEKMEAKVNVLTRAGYSKIHSWLLPVFAVGLGCPRWCQMYWGVSGLGLYVPWAGSAGPYV
jgi:alpha-1,3-glucan synthase